MGLQGIAVTNCRECKSLSCSRGLECCRMDLGGEEPGAGGQQSWGGFGDTSLSSEMTLGHLPVL